LTNLPSLINNVLNAPTPDTALLQALSKAAASQQDFSSAFTGAAQLEPLILNAQNTANAARADALKTTKDLQAQAMATVGNIVGGIYGGNPNAGSNAAAALSGKGGQQSSTPSPSKGQTPTPPQKGQTPPSTGGQQDGGTPSAPGADGGSPDPGVTFV